MISHILRMALFGGGSPAIPQYLNILGGGSISVTSGPNNQNSYITANNQTVVDSANTVLLNLAMLTVQTVQAQSLTTSFLNAGSNTSVTGIASAGTLLSSVLVLPKTQQPPVQRKFQHLEAASTSILQTTPSRP